MLDQLGALLFVEATLLAHDLDTVLKGSGHQHGDVVGVVSQQVIGQTALDNAAFGLTQVQDHLAHLLEQLVRVRTRIVAVGQKRHVLNSQALVIGRHLVERFARTQRRAHQQLVVVQRNPQLVGKHAANLVTLGTKVTRDGNDHRIVLILQIAHRDSFLYVAKGLSLCHIMPPQYGADMLGPAAKCQS